MQSSFMPLSKLSINYSTVVSIFVLFLLCLMPIYIFPSGGLQLVDLVIVPFIPFAILTLNKQELEFSILPIVALAAYVAWTICNTFAYFTLTSNVFYIKVIAQNIFGASIFCTFVIVFQKLLIKKSYLILLHVSLLFAFIPAFFVKGLYDASSEDLNIFGGRGALSFNNPNQLGYYAVLAFAMFILLRLYSSRFEFSGKQNFLIKFTAIFVFMASHLFVVYSASRAAVICIALLDMLVFLKLRRLIFIIACCLLPLLLLFMSSPLGHMLTHNKLVDVMVVKRLTQGGIETDASSRVEGNFFKNLPYQAALLYGAGKATHNFNKKEVHNGFFDILLSYGIIGFILFFLFLYALVARFMGTLRYYNQLYYLLPLVPIFLYNAVHNGFRFRLFWVALAFWYTMASNNTVKIEALSDKATLLGPHPSGSPA
jgi:hypothetical protein